MDKKVQVGNSAKIAQNRLLVAVLRPLKRLAGFALFFISMLFFGCTVFSFLCIFYGIDRANEFMDDNVLPFVDWWE